MPAYPPYMQEQRFVTGDSPNGEDNSTRCPGVQHHHWQHHDVGLESSARDGVPWQQRALDIGKAKWASGFNRRQNPGAPIAPGFFLDTIRRPRLLLIAPATPIAIVTVWPVAITIIAIGPVVGSVAIAVIATAIVSSVINLFDGRIVFRLSWQSSNTWTHRGLGFRSDGTNNNQHRAHHT